MPENTIIGAQLLDMLAELLKPPSKGYLTKRQEEYFRRRKPRRSERISLMRRLPTPQERRQQAQEQQGENWIDKLREQAMKYAVDKAKTADKEAAKLAAEDRKAQRETQKSQIDFLKERGEYYAELAKSDPINAQAYQRKSQEYFDQVEKMLMPEQEAAAEERAPLTEEDIAIMEKAPEMISDIDAKLQKLHEGEEIFNLSINDPDIPDALKRQRWNQLTEMNYEIGRLNRQKRSLQNLLGRKGELEDMQAQAKLQVNEQLKERQARTGVVADIAEKERKLEEYEKKPVLTREEEIGYAAAGAGAKAGAVAGAKQPFEIAEEERKKAAKIQAEERAMTNERLLGLFRARQAGDREADKQLKAMLSEEYDEPTKEQETYDAHVEELEAELKLARQSYKEARIGKKGAKLIEQEGDRFRKVQGKLADLKKKGRPRRKQSKYDYVQKRTREIKKMEKADTGVTLPQGWSMFDYESVKGAAAAGNLFAKEMLKELGLE